MSTPTEITHPTPTTNIPLPEFPEYSTQEMPTPQETRPASILKSRWTNKDDILLCSSWLNISKDAAVGNDQSVASGSFSAKYGRKAAILASLLQQKACKSSSGTGTVRFWTVPVTDFSQPKP
nr:glutathione S-transferase T3-like [Ipomoea batatas]